MQREQKMLLQNAFMLTRKGKILACIETVAVYLPIAASMQLLLALSAGWNNIEWISTISSPILIVLVLLVTLFRGQSNPIFVWKLFSPDEKAILTYKELRTKQIEHAIKELQEELEKLKSF